MAKKKTKTKANKKNTKKKASTASSRGRNSRAKGLQFERDVANALRGIFPDAERELEYQQSQIDGRDLKGTQPLAIQCKNHAAYCSINTIREVNPCDEYNVPCLITKGARVKAVAVLYFDDFVRLLESAYTNRGNVEAKKIEAHPDAVITSKAFEKVTPSLKPGAVTVVPDERTLDEMIAGPEKCSKCGELTVQSEGWGGTICRPCNLEFFEGATYCIGCDMDVDYCECEKVVLSKPIVESLERLAESTINILEENGYLDEEPIEHVGIESFI